MVSNPLFPEHLPGFTTAGSTSAVLRESHLRRSALLPLTDCWIVELVESAYIATFASISENAATKAEVLVGKP